MPSRRVNPTTASRPSDDNWRDVLSGRGGLYLSATGNRYNTVLQQAAATVSDDLLAAVTEFAYYAALNWGGPARAGRGRFTPA